MLSITPLKSKDPSGGAGRAPQYLTSTQYYRDKDGQERSASAWLGQGSRSLGLQGKAVTEELMNRLSTGFAPDGKTPLRQNAGAKPETKTVRDRKGKPRLDADGKELTATHGVRIGHDLTWSAPKPVSALMALGEPALHDILVDCQHAAVGVGMNFIEKRVAETRRGKGGKDVMACELVASRHTHFGARPHEKDWTQRGDHDMDVDPQLHTHVLLYNLGKAADGSWGALEPKEIYRWKKAAGALYRAELAHQLRQRLGFEIEEDIRYDRDGKVSDRFWKIKGLPDELLEQLSGRRKEILAYQQEHGGSAQQATLMTRRNKDEPSFDELRARWKDDIATWRREHPGQLPDNILDLCSHAKPERSRQTQQQRDAEILAELHETKSVWTRADLTQKLAERSTGLSASQVWREVSSYLKRNELQLIEPEQIHKDDRGRTLSRRHTETRFADPKVVKQEQDIVTMAKERKNDARVRLDAGAVKKAIADMEKERGFSLSQEQRRAVEFATVGSGGIAIIQGRAGTGKTTAFDAIVKAYRDSGRDVIGCATAWKAAKKLEAESGVPSHSIARLVKQLDQGKIKLTERSVVLVDEAGMMGTPSLHALIRHAHEAGAKVLMGGDVLQLQSVERGAPMRQLAKEIGLVELKDIKRQKHQADRDIANAYYDAGGTELRSRAQEEAAGQKIIAMMEARGQVQAFDTRDQSREYLVKDYLASSKPARNKLLLASTRADVEAINASVRDGLKARGELGVEHPVGILNPRTGKIQSLPLAEGDRVHFIKRNDALDVVNGTLIQVTRVTPDGKGHFTVEGRIESDIPKQDGRKVTFQAHEVALEHAYSTTVHKSQGQSVSEVYHLGHRGMTDRQLSLVGFTRMKDSYTLYGPIEELFDRSGDAAYAHDRLQVNALEEGLSRKHRGLTTTQYLREKALRQDVAVPPVEHQPSKFRRLAIDALETLRSRLTMKPEPPTPPRNRERGRDRD